jgi:prefoldin subunit 5
MSEVELLLGREVFRIPGLALRQICQTFAINPLPLQYIVTSTVSVEVFRLFLSALKGETIEVTKANFLSLSSLCKESGFELQNLSFRLSEIEVSIEGLQSDIRRLSSDITSLQNASQMTAQHSEAITRLSSHITSLQNASQITSQHSEVIKQLSADITSLHRNCEITFQHSEVIRQLSVDVSVLKRWSRVPESEILCDFPEFFTEFRGKRFEILWRGSRDGFEAQEFHRRCDGHSNTLTVILDTKGNIFGGFTPVEWDSRVWNGYWADRDNMPKVDDSLKSFLFTLKNPHNIPARRFALKAEAKHKALFCGRFCGPSFGDDIHVCHDCNKDTWSFTSLGATYTNDTGLDEGIVFTGSLYFQVKEIEVFEIAA